MVLLVAKQAATAAEGARLAEAMTKGEVTAEEARTSMAAIEHRGDNQRASLVFALGRSLTAPIDREDLFRLSRSIDDVLDNLRDFVRESHLYHVHEQAGMSPLLAVVSEGLDELRRAVKSVARSPGAVVDHALQAKKHCNRVRQLYQLELAELFSREVSTEMFKGRELLRRIDVASLRIGEAADALLDGVLKRRH